MLQAYINSTKTHQDAQNARIAQLENQLACQQRQNEELSTMVSFLQGRLDKNADTESLRSSMPFLRVKKALKSSRIFILCWNPYADDGNHLVTWLQQGFSRLGAAEVGDVEIKRYLDLNAADTLAEAKKLMKSLRQTFSNYVEYHLIQLTSSDPRPVLSPFLFSPVCTLIIYAHTEFFFFSSEKNEENRSDKSFIRDYDVWKGDVLAAMEELSLTFDAPETADEKFHLLSLMEFSERIIMRMLEEDINNQSWAASFAGSSHH